MYSSLMTFEILCLGVGVVSYTGPTSYTAAVVDVTDQTDYYFTIAQS